MSVETSEPPKSLSVLFQGALDKYVKIDKGDVPATDQQTVIKTTIKDLEDSTRLINAASIFSSNEMLEEVQTECIQYLAIPAMLGLLVGKLQNSDRLNTLETEEIYLKDFLVRGKEYGIVPDTVNIEELVKPPSFGGGALDLTKVVTDRNTKIRKFEEQKRLQEELVHLREKLDSGDEEVKRKYYTNFVKNFVFIVEEELKSIALEKPLAEKMKRDKESGGPKKKEREYHPPPPLKPIIITRNEFEKKVYGAGYPSLPTMTVDEFYEDRVKQGIFPSGPSNYGKSMQQMADPEFTKAQDEEEATQKELAEETDDAEALEKARRMDDFKDTHRRGFGNRFNRS